MSKLTNDGLTRSGTGCFIAVPTATVHGRQRVNETSTNLYRHWISQRLNQQSQQRLTA